MHLVPIQSGDVNRENTFPDRNRIHPKYVCTCTRENSRSPRSSIFNSDCVCRLSNLCALVTQRSQPSFSTLLYSPLSLLFSSCMPPTPLYLFLSLSRHARIFTSTAFWPRVLARLVEGLLPVRAEISVRKFRSLAASESATKLNINLPDYSDAILCPSVLLRSPSCLFLSLDTNLRLVPSRKQATCYSQLLRKIVKRTK